MTRKIGISPKNIPPEQNALWLPELTPEQLDPTLNDVREPGLSALQLIAREQDSGTSPYGPAPDESDLARQDSQSGSELIARQRAKMEKAQPKADTHLETAERIAAEVMDQTVEKPSNKPQKTKINWNSKDSGLIDRDQVRIKDQLEREARDRAKYPEDYN